MLVTSGLFAAFRERGHRSKQPELYRALRAHYNRLRQLFDWNMRIDRFSTPVSTLSPSSEKRKIKTGPSSELNDTDARALEMKFAAFSPSHQTRSLMLQGAKSV
jgi:hypothetical protein